ncbi:MAG TPA: homoserine dehydrogenase [Cyclobacteriaceae bacterium]|nr:homoserine dehydrogenase [Cyclobacteriaceae bacterium]
MSKHLKLGLFGFGCVGQGLYHVLHETHGVKASIKKICVKHANKQRPIDASFFTLSKEEILNDPDIDVVVELIDDSEAAFAIVKEALSKGKAVVTANKKMIAEHFQDLYDLQVKYNQPVLYEGSVCGSIPIIRNLEEYYDNDLIESIEGIFNGSTNYILTEIFDGRKSYHEALKKAQELGFAESNPDLDVKAFDPKFKLCIAIAHTFGVFVKPELLVNFGIDKISDVDLKYARENGYTIKLIARAFKQNGKVYGLVAPQFIESTHLLANVRYEYNAVLVQGAFAEKQIFVGKGAGSYPTGSAVLSDVSALVYDYRYEYKKRQQDHLTFSNEASVNVVVSFTGEKVKPTDFLSFSGGYKGNGHQFLRGAASFEKLREWAATPDVSVILDVNTRIAPIQVPEKEAVTVA